MSTDELNILPLYVEAGDQHRTVQLRHKEIVADAMKGKLRTNTGNLCVGNYREREDREKDDMSCDV